MTDHSVKPPAALRRGERGRWLVVIPAMIVLVYMGWSLTAQQITNAKSDKALRKDKALVTSLAVVATQAENAATDANNAVAQVRAAVACINSLLGSRGPLTTADTNAEVDIFTRLLGVLDAPTSQQAGLYTKFLIATRKDVAVLQKDKRIRTDKPLGHC